MVREIKKIYTAKAVTEGAGVQLNRVFGFSELPEFDPFLLLDDFRSTKKEDYIKGFPWHPHRGIETITYVLRGKVEHGDSLNNAGTIGPGDVEWMTAGSGIIHQEMPKGDEEGFMEGFQLWSNLPASHKMMPPRYRGIKSSEIPEIHPQEGVTIKIICGQIGDTKGPAADVISNPQYLDITLAENTLFTLDTPPGHTLLTYVIQGKGLFGPESTPAQTTESKADAPLDHEAPMVSNKSLVLFEKGDSLRMQSLDTPLRFLLISGLPIGEPIAWYGPIVMNTQEELQKAFEEYRQGSFIKNQKP